MLMTEFEIFSSWVMSAGMIAVSIYVAFRVHRYIGVALASCYLVLAAQSYILIYTGYVSWGPDGLAAPSWYSAFQFLRSVCALALPVMLFMLARMARPEPAALNKAKQEGTP